MDPDVPREVPFVHLVQQGYEFKGVISYPGCGLVFPELVKSGFISHVAGQVYAEKFCKYSRKAGR